MKTLVIKDGVRLAKSKDGFYYITKPDRLDFHGYSLLELFNLRNCIDSFFFETAIKKAARNK